MASKNLRELVPFFVPNADEVNDSMRVYSSGSEDLDQSSVEDVNVRVWDKGEGFFVSAPQKEKQSHPSRRNKKSKRSSVNNVTPKKYAGLTFETKVPEPSELPLPRTLIVY
mmetsp:Transcript_12395/g.37833  ORF Transcript_12395/g.37833 Transcript_12395/m.37833 type:complete len:111 (+) Transcript_12395:137-469(+)|eukprot:CAMPEP_0198726774 /NCGR_PEP_ID=MMETSP1475-20131203/3720_1 /TAXON_ID= ORGANISM="Unidentified sp., Strain CCMP1999" /NCGR_SAMPLE_ID=MMETSP1475 /ASSEMBLY_ACC=CAM_ASM_001111 /LENGTH=110 /DNA_ID=CAMNT_0044488735 /DNA_START=81 /DNA_END=413 /DNA_ORIENTATION=+